MDLSDLSDAFRLQSLSTARRTLSLRWSASLADRLAPVLLPQRAVITEGICREFEARIACFTTQSNLPLKLFVGLLLALTIATGTGPPRRIPMIVAEAALGRSATRGLTVVDLVGRDPLTLIGARRRLRTLRDQTARDVVSAVLDHWRRASPLGGSFTFRFASKWPERYQPRACHVQHPDESDREFVERLLRVDGWAWSWRLADRTEPGRLPRLELLIFETTRPKAGRFGRRRAGHRLCQPPRQKRAGHRDDRPRAADHGAGRAACQRASDRPDP